MDHRADVGVPLLHPERPPRGSPREGNFGTHIGLEARVESQVVAQHAQGVFAHRLAREQLGQFRGKVQTKLQRPGRQIDAQIVVGR